MSDLDALRREVLAAVNDAPDAAAVEAVRVSALGKKGRLTALMKGLGAMAPEKRRAFGRAVNALKADVIGRLNAREAAFAKAALNERLAGERIDLTLPARPEAAGALHPISQTLDEMIAIFGHMGFSVAEGPDIEDDFHNFAALNFPPDHPARDMQDTFFLRGNDTGGRRLLRTHTSPVQIRVMTSRKPPIRIIVPGRVYRCDSDMTHTPMFHQIEGLAIDETTHMGHLKGCLSEAVETYFEAPDLAVRFRPSFFPFTEPSAEIDIGCDRSGGDLKIGQGRDWLEVIGCGMVHPNVLTACGLDPEKYQGFAFGMGLERLAMLKYGIPDMRAFFDSDVRWLRHYGFGPHDVPSLTGGLTR